MSRFTRVTVVGSARRGEIVLPSDEELAVLLPQILDLVAEPPGQGTVTLVRNTGDQLDVGHDLQTLGLPDGEILRVVHTQDAPPPAEVADVTEAATDVLADLPGRWDEQARRATGAAGVGLIAGAAGIVPAYDAGPDSGTAVVLGIVLVALLGLAASAPRARSRRERGAWLRLAAASAATGLGPALGLAVAALPAVADLVGPVPGRAALELAGIVAFAVACCALWASGVSRRSRGMLTGAGAGVGLVLLAAVPVGFDLGADRAAAVVATAATILLGVLPAVALSTSGVHRLDDATLEGERPDRQLVVPTLEEAYRALTWATVTTGTALAFAAAVLLSTPSAWARVLGVAVLLVAALRVRPLPLTAQVVPLWGAVGIATVVGALAALGDRPGLTAVVLGALALVVTFMVSRTPNAQQRARWRRAGDVLELLAMLVVVPAVLGVFGVYELLLGVF
ncbi:EsaB/YukD family protein [Promicromonospora sp. NPDC057488]|uniref:EsaB/YukD family protein n=1 Tax=Promicromonospora sp. NPDC057488 TaxID=3346147 RepID=UPI00366FFD98